MWSRVVAPQKAPQKAPPPRAPEPPPPPVVEEPEPEPEPETNLERMSKDELIRLAEDAGVDIDRRWSATRIVDAIKASRDEED
jgi:hypothetical protein